MSAPRDAKTAFVRNNVLTVVDGRGNVWHYDPSVTEDAAGNDIVAPADFARAEFSDNAIMVIDSGGVIWLFNLATGLWHKGLVVDDNLPGEAEATTNPWKRGHNVETPAAVPEETTRKKSKAAA